MKVKEKFHQLIDNIDDEEMLNAYYDLISQLEIQESGTLYKNLTDTQKNELSIAYTESFVASNLLSHKDVKAQHQQWL